MESLVLRDYCGCESLLVDPMELVSSHAIPGAVPRVKEHKKSLPIKTPVRPFY